MKIKLLGKNLEELRQVVSSEGLPGFTARQIAQWLYVKKVREMMRAWLDENMPEAEIENCEALSLWSYDHAIYLTDYVRGNILHKGEKMSFTIHTVTGQVFFNHQQQEFADAVRTYLCEAAGIPFETEESDFSCAYMAPICAHDTEGNAKFGCDYLDLGIPAEVQNIEAFVRDPGSRLQIDVMWTKPSPPEGTDFSAYSLALFRDLRQSCGLRIDQLGLLYSYGLEIIH